MFSDSPLVGRALFPFAVTWLGLPASDIETARCGASGACVRNPQERAFPVQCRRSFHPHGQTLIAFAVPHIDNVRQPGLGAQRERLLRAATPRRRQAEGKLSCRLFERAHPPLRPLDCFLALTRITADEHRAKTQAPSPPTEDAAPPRLPMNLARPNKRVKWL